ncbi:single-stranded DNA-binding protein [Mesoplasma photuris]|uniref:single-stranded DNA-binding protein n=1 Tax=Mesoplasma photuris TaxID=217731 RepID=UPI0004E26563|nr:single-stranded DNA-binding protein [Mesoplasma photuris]
MNQVVIIGRITKDPELRTATNGKPFVGFTVAVSEYSGGNEFTNFIPCMAFDKNAENMAKFLKKGAQVAVSGRISVRSREVDGRRQDAVNVNADRVQFLDSKTTSSNSSSNSEYVKNDSNIDLDQMNSFAGNNQPIKDTSSVEDIIENDDSILWD